MFYDMLKKVCDEKKVKMTPVVIQAGGSKGQMNGWKSGSSPNIDIVMRIANILNVSTDYLIFGETPLPEDLPSEEKELLDEFRKLDFKGKSSVMQTILNEQERMNSASISKSMKDTIKTVDNFTTVTKPK